MSLAQGAVFEKRHRSRVRACFSNIAQKFHHDREGDVSTTVAASTENNVVDENESVELRQLRGTLGTARRMYPLHCEDTSKRKSKSKSSSFSRSSLMTVWWTCWSLCSERCHVFRRCRKWRRSLKSRSWTRVWMFEWWHRDGSRRPGKVQKTAVRCLWRRSSTMG